MISVKTFVFNPFRENTYLLVDDTKECVIIDPGCYDPAEKKILKDYIEKNGFLPKLLLNTHCHLDHIFGNNFVRNTYGIDLCAHKGELQILQLALQTGEMYGTPFREAPSDPDVLLEDGQVLKFGQSELRCIHAPGHSPGSICYYSAADGILFSGDVLFHNSIGRTDLPGGDYETLINSIRSKLLILDDDIKVYPGHEMATSIGHERSTNPFL